MTVHQAGFALVFGAFVGFLFGAVFIEVGVVPWMIGMLVLAAVSIYFGIRTMLP